MVRFHHDFHLWLLYYACYIRSRYVWLITYITHVIFNPKRNYYIAVSTFLEVICSLLYYYYFRVNELKKYVHLLFSLTDWLWVHVLNSEYIWLTDFIRTNTCFHFISSRNSGNFWEPEQAFIFEIVSRKSMKHWQEHIFRCFDFLMTVHTDWRVSSYNLLQLCLLKQVIAYYRPSLEKATFQILEAVYFPTACFHWAY